MTRGKLSTTCSGSTPTAKQFNDFAKCIQKAGSNDPAAVTKCEAILK